MQPFPRFPALVSLFFCLLTWCAPAALVATPPGWRPGTFEVFCGHPLWEKEYKGPDGEDRLSNSFYAQRIDEDPDIEVESFCPPDAVRKRVERDTGKALALLSKMGFAPPGHRLGPVVRGRSGGLVTRMYADDDHVGYASVRSACLKDKMPPDHIAFIRFNPSFFSTVRAPVAFRMMAHEMVHLVQNGQELWNGAGTDKCSGIPDWLVEGSADAVSVDLLDRSGYARYRPAVHIKGAKSIYGLRRWDRALTWASGGKDRWGHSEIPEYRVSSFWTYLAERYFGGRFDYLGRWWRHTDGKGGRDDWLDWLDDRLRADSGGVDQPLYLVFPDFLANYAAWGRTKHKNIGDEVWLQESFNCRDLTLSTRQPSHRFELELEPLSGQCLRITVAGLEDGARARVEIMAEAKEVAHVDDLHLAASRLGGELATLGRGFDCYEASKSRSPDVLCVNKPFVGSRGEQASTVETDRGRFAKTWLTEPQVASGSSFENLYIVTRAPLLPKDGLHDIERRGTSAKRTVRLTVGLEVTNFETGARGKAKAAKADVKAPFETQPVPMRGGEDAAAGLQAAAAGDAEALSKLPFAILSAGDLPGAAGVETDEGGLRRITLSQLPEDATVDEPELMLTLLLEKPIPYGARGRYPALVTGESEVGVEPAMPSLDNPLAGMASAIVNAGPEPTGTVIVERWDEDFLQLRVEGTYCLGRDLDLQSRSCRRIERFSGLIFKPFGWTYGAETFTSIDTPGIAAYREYLTGALDEVAPGLFPVLESSGGDSAGGAGGGDGADGDGGAEACDCTCAGRDKLREAAEAMDEAHQRGETVTDTSALMAQAACAMQCARQWAGCE